MQVAGPHLPSDSNRAALRWGQGFYVLNLPPFLSCPHGSDMGGRGPHSVKCAVSLGQFPRRQLGLVCTPAPSQLQEHRDHWVLSITDSALCPSANIQ